MPFQGKEMTQGVPRPPGRLGGNPLRVPGPAYCFLKHSMGFVSGSLFCYAVQLGLELLGSSDPPVPAFQVLRSQVGLLLSENGGSGCTLVMQAWDASFSSRARAVSTWPSRAAVCRGVWPAVVARLGLAPFSSRSFTMFVWPMRAAQ